MQFHSTLTRRKALIGMLGVLQCGLMGTGLLTVGCKRKTVTKTAEERITAARSFLATGLTLKQDPLLSLVNKVPIVFINQAFIPSRQGELQAAWEIEQQRIVVAAPIALESHLLLLAYVIGHEMCHAQSDFTPSKSIAESHRIELRTHESERLIIIPAIELALKATPSPTRKEMQALKLIIALNKIKITSYKAFRDIIDPFVLNDWKHLELALAERPYLKSLVHDEVEKVHSSWTKLNTGFSAEQTEADKAAEIIHFVKCMGDLINRRELESLFKDTLINAPQWKALVEELEKDRQEFTLALRTMNER
jgi:hypothetical protein